jgi:hypothetical protein
MRAVSVALYIVPPAVVAVFEVGDNGQRPRRHFGPDNRVGVEVVGVVAAP